MVGVVSGFLGKDLRSRAQSGLAFPVRHGLGSVMEVCFYFEILVDLHAQCVCEDLPNQILKDLQGNGRILIPIFPTKQILNCHPSVVLVSQVLT